MKAAVYRDVRKLSMEELPDPRPTDNEVLIKIKRCGLCGTDVHMYYGTNDEGTFPFIPGHEWLGEVVEVGSSVSGLKIGDRVMGDPVVACGYCQNCQDGMDPMFCDRLEYHGFTWEHPGGFCEYLVSSPQRLIKIPKNLTDDEAALAEPVSVAYHGLWGNGRSVAPHDCVCILGGGPIGLCGVQIAKVAGAPVILVEPIPYRRQFALDLGADAVVDPTSSSWMDEFKDFTEGRGATIVMEASGSDAAIASTVDLVRPHGTIVLVGHSVGDKIPVRLKTMHWKDATMQVSLGQVHYFGKTLVFLSRHLFDSTRIVTHHFPLAEMQKALELGRDPVKSCKIMIDIA